MLHHYRCLNRFINFTVTESIFKQISDPQSCCRNQMSFDVSVCVQWNAKWIDLAKKSVFCIFFFIQMFEATKMKRAVNFLLRSSRHTKTFARALIHCVVFVVRDLRVTFVLDWKFLLEMGFSVSNSSVSHSRSFSLAKWNERVRFVGRNELLVKFPLSSDKEIRNELMSSHTTANRKWPSVSKTTQTTTIWHEKITALFAQLANMVNTEWERKNKHTLGEAVERKINKNTGQWFNRPLSSFYANSNSATLEVEKTTNRSEHTIPNCTNTHEK